MRRVPPPDQHIGLIQTVCRQSMLRLLQCRSLENGFGAQPCTQSLGQRLVNALGINGSHLCLGPFVNKLVPHRDA